MTNPNSIDPNQLLTQLRAMAAEAGGQGQGAGQTDAAGGGEFAAALKQAVESVNTSQQQAGKLAEAFELGDPNVDLSQVMVALQKANLSFEAMKQVRNKLVSAYQEIMNMPI